MSLPQSGHGIHCGQLILRKISKTGATRCQILRLKCIKFNFRWGIRPRPIPRPLAVLKGLLLSGGRGKGREGKGREREEEWRGGLPPLGESGSASVEVNDVRRKM